MATEIDINQNLFEIIKNKFPLELTSNSNSPSGILGLDLSVNLFLLVNNIRNGCFIVSDNNPEIEEIIHLFQEKYPNLYYYQIPKNQENQPQGYFIVNSNHNQTITSNQTLEDYVKYNYNIDNNYNRVIGSICQYQFVYDFNGNCCSFNDPNDAYLSLNYQILQTSPNSDEKKLLKTARLFSWTIKSEDIHSLNLEPLLSMKNGLEKLLEKMFPDKFVSTNIGIQIGHHNCNHRTSQWYDFIEDPIFLMFAGASISLISYLLCEKYL